MIGASVPQLAAAYINLTEIAPFVSKEQLQCAYSLFIPYAATFPYRQLFSSHEQHMRSWLLAEAKAVAFLSGDCHS